MSDEQDALKEISKMQKMFEKSRKQAPSLGMALPIAVGTFLESQYGVTIDWQIMSLVGGSVMYLARQMVES